MPKRPMTDEAPGQSAEKSMRTAHLVASLGRRLEKAVTEGDPKDICERVRAALRHAAPLAADLEEESLKGLRMAVMASAFTPLCRSREATAALVAEVVRVYSLEEMPSTQVLPGYYTGRLGLVEAERLPACYAEILLYVGRVPGEVFGLALNRLTDLFGREHVAFLLGALGVYSGACSWTPGLQPLADSGYLTPEAVRDHNLLHAACQNKTAGEHVIRFLDKYAGPLTPDLLLPPAGGSPPGMACSANNVGALAALVKWAGLGREIAATPQHGILADGDDRQTLLEIACRYKHHELIPVLAEKVGLRREDMLSNGGSAIDAAVCDGDDLPGSVATVLKLKEYFGLTAEEVAPAVESVREDDPARADSIEALWA